MIQNVPGVGRVIPGQQINAPTKRNRTRPWTLGPSISSAVMSGSIPCVNLSATLKTGQFRVYSYPAITAAIADLMVTSATGGADAGGVAKKFTRGRTGGKAFAVPIRAQPVVVTAP